MLLLLVMNLGMAAGVAVTPVPPINLGGGGSNYQSTSYHSKSQEKEEQEKREKILIDDSAIVAIVELTLKHFII